MVGRTGIERRKVLWVINCSEFLLPLDGLVKELVSNHVEQRRNTEHRSKEVWPLCHRGTDQQAGVRAAEYSELIRTCEAFSNQPIRCRDKVIESDLTIP